MIALINGSPKFEESSSELLLDRFEKVESENPAEFDIEVLKACDTWFFFEPVQTRHALAVIENFCEKCASNNAHFFV